MSGSASDSVDDFILTRTDPRWCNGVADWTVAVEASSSSDSHAHIRKPSRRRVSQKKTEAQKEADKLTRLLAMPSKFGPCSTHGTMLLPWLHKSGQHAGRIMLRCRLGKNLLLAILCTLNMCIFLRFIRKDTFIASGNFEHLVYNLSSFHLSLHGLVCMQAMVSVQKAEARKMLVLR